MVEKLLTHIPFHPRAHDVPLISNIIGAEHLQNVRAEEPRSDDRKPGEDSGAVFGEKRGRQRSEDLRIEDIHQTDDGCTEQINKENGFIWLIVTDEFP